MVPPRPRQGPACPLLTLIIRWEEGSITSRRKNRNCNATGRAQGDAADWRVWAEGSTGGAVLQNMAHALEARLASHIG